MQPIRRAAQALISLPAIGVIAWLALRFMPGSRPFTDLNERLQSILSDLVRKDGSVKNCVLSVMTGDGSLLWSGAAGIAREDVPMTGDTPIYIASITKLYTATAVMLLIEKGNLWLDDPVAKYLPSELISGIHVYKGKDYSEEITVRELLSHTSGIADYYSDKARDGKNLFELFIANPDRSKFPPGTDTSYSDTNYQLLGKVIEAVSGKPLHVFYEDFLFRPLGLGNTWLVGHCRSEEGQCPAGIRLPWRQEYHQESLEWGVLGRWRDYLDCGRDERLLEGPQGRANY
jgi:D-alanyl-D-alanine carboxypeptidase